MQLKRPFFHGGDKILEPEHERAIPGYSHGVCPERLATPPGLAALPDAETKGLL